MRRPRNSLDAVSDRDFALDYLMAAAQCALHLSRLAEEFIIWASQPFGFVRLPDALSTGSSIMPQKKNPDAAELVRGHAGRIIGCATALMVTMKGLPLAYSKDMQDDKPPVFEAASLLALSHRRDDRDGGRQRPSGPTGCGRRRSLAMPPPPILADWLVREADIPFREAHHITGAAVKLAERRAWRSMRCRSRNFRRSIARIDERVFARCRSMRRWRRARPMAEPRRSG